MPDKYANFANLSQSEPVGSFRIEIRPTGSSVVLIAPHAGKIEPGTSEICRSIAGNDLTYYLFEGCKQSGNRDLHITSSRFDEPQALAVAAGAQIIVTVHGQSGTDRFVNVGGLADELCASIINSLVDAGFSANRQNNPMLQGREPSNICNCGTSGKGVQLEISRCLRDALVADPELLSEFTAAVRSAWMYSDV